MVARLLLCMIVVTALASAAISPASAAEANPAKAAYLKYCSACHGEGAKGDGVVSGLMQPPPPNLTLLAKNAGGNFPTGSVMQAIDGTTTPRHCRIRGRDSRNPSNDHD